MSASVIGAIASSVTTALLAAIALWIRRLVRLIGLHKKEHEFLMRTTTRNTLIIRKLLQHLDASE